MSSRLRYWHPVLPARELRPRRVRAVKLAGHAIAIFRAENGNLGAVTDQCAHRRMKLSLGRVQNGRLVCPYHGWSFSDSGAGESPSAPKMHACLTSYDCAEAFGVIWLRARGSEQPLPDLLPNEGNFAGPVFNRVNAPLQLVIDNFSEVEHTVAMHPQFGFDPQRASEAVAELTTTNDAVTMCNRGPAKMPPLTVRVAAGIKVGDYFHSDYTFRFDPPRSSVTHHWSGAESGRERAMKYHIFHYFVPEDAERTTIVSFGFLSMRLPLVRHFRPIASSLFRRKIRQTLDEDAALLENLADKSPELEGMKLSRFDSILSLTRDRLGRIYDAS